MPTLLADRPGNRLTGVSGGASASFVYDRDGKRVKATVNGVTTVYIGDYYEQQGSTIKRYYYAGSQRVAMRENSTLYWLLSDHLGSTAKVASGSTQKGELRYKAWGENRYSSGRVPTQRQYTGQVLDSSTGLYYYGARYYDPLLGRFVQADPIVPEPGNPQDLNRYSYTRNNPLRYTDPSGHCANADYTARGCPQWMPDWLFGAFEAVAALTVMDTAFAPAEEGQPNDLADLTERADARWYEGTGLGLIDPFDWADSANRCLEGDCSLGIIIGAAAPGISGRVGGQMLSHAWVRFAQRGISRVFRYGEFAGKTIDEVVAGLKSGAISPDQLPIKVIERDGVIYTLNNRSLMALRLAGLEPTVIEDVTGQGFFERQLTERLLEIGREVGPDFVPVIRGGSPR